MQTMPARRRRRRWRRFKVGRLFVLKTRPAWKPATSAAKVAAAAAAPPAALPADPPPIRVWPLVPVVAEGGACGECKQHRYIVVHGYLGTLLLWYLWCTSNQ